MEQLTLQVVPREGQGKGEARKLRQAGFILGIVYGKDNDPLCVSFDAKAWRSATHEGLRIGRLVELLWKGKKKTKHVVLVREIQTHPVTDSAMHVDFQLVRAGEELELDVPITLVGTPIGVKDEGGKLDFHLRQIHIKCIPSKIPNEITLDITELKAGDTLHVQNISWEDGEILTDEALAVVSVLHAVEEEVEEEEEEAGEEEEVQEAEESTEQ